MTNQPGQKVSLMKLIFALISLGACLTVVVILFAIPLDADLVSDCWFLYSDDIELLASCLDWTVDRSLTPETEEPPPPGPELSSESPTHSCDGDYPVISFEFDQPVNGQFVLYWSDDGGTKNYSVTIQDSTIVNFRLARATVSGEMYNFYTMRLTSQDGVTIHYMNTETLQFESCSPQDEDEPAPSMPTSTPNPDGVPVIISSVCLNDQQLMIVFEFQQPVTGLYGVLVNNVPYLPTPVPDQPKRLFFFGAAPPGGGMPTIVMQSLPDQTVVFEKSDYSVPQCDFERQNDAGGGGDDVYVPPP